jgi:hypothetical protein
MTGGTPSPVRVRNISSRGAFIDGSGLPPEGASVELRRGSLSAAGEIAWRRNDQCGIRFDFNVNVEAWVKRPGSSGQQRVDSIVDLLKRGPSERDSPIGPASTEDSFETISSDLTELTEHFANSANMLASEPEALLRLDVIAQRLRQAVEIWRKRN